MADDEDLAPPDDLLPPRAGQGTFLGLKPADWLATLGGLLSGVPLGRGPVSSQMRPFNALFPLAQGFANSDARSRQQAGVDALQSQYGGEKDLPEFKTAILLANQGDIKGAMQLLGRGLSERNTRGREARLATQTGQAAEAWGQAQAPVRVPGTPGIPALPESPQVGQDDDFVPAIPGTPSTPDSERAPELSEIYAKLQAIADPTIRGLAYAKGDSTIAARNLEDVKLRPKTEVHDRQFIHYDPRRGTATAGEMLPETPGQKSVRERDDANAARYKALTARAERDPNAQLGSKMNPHVSYQTFEDAQGVRKRHQIESWVEADPNAPGGVKRQSRVVPLGATPFRPFAPRGSGAVDTTTTVDVETTKPSKPIWKAEELESINKGVTKVLGNIAPGFRPPGLTEVVTLPNGKQSTGKDVIEQLRKDLETEYKNKHGLDVSIRWVPTPGWINKNAGEFRVTGAAESAQKLPKKSVTTKQKGTFPAPVMPPPPADDDND